MDKDVFTGILIGICALCVFHATGHIFLSIAVITGLGAIIISFGSD